MIARTSIERAQRDSDGAAGIARALSADYVVGGHIRRDGDRVRITAYLIDSGEETQLWAGAFERLFRDDLSLQADIAGEISAAVTETVCMMQRAKAS